jgi:pentatricopeptide repeat protein
MLLGYNRICSVAANMCLHGIGQEREPMEELYELRHYLEAGKYKEALTLLDEMEEMSRDDKINGIATILRSALHKIQAGR